MKEEDINYINFVKTLNKNNFTLIHTYNRIDEVQEIIRHFYLLPRGDGPIAIKVKEIDFVLFKTKSLGLIVMYVCAVKNEKFELYEMNTKTYSDYETYILSLQ